MLRNNYWLIRLPWEFVVLHTLLSILSPSISIIKNINLTPCLKSKSPASRLLFLIIISLSRRRHLRRLRSSLHHLHRWPFTNRNHIFLRTTPRTHRHVAPRHVGKQRKPTGDGRLPELTSMDSGGLGSSRNQHFLEREGGWRRWSWEKIWVTFHHLWERERERQTDRNGGWIILWLKFEHS